jgi:hypothetical protein
MLGDWWLVWKEGNGLSDEEKKGCERLFFSVGGTGGDGSGFVDVEEGGGFCEAFPNFFGPGGFSLFGR